MWSDVDPTPREIRAAFLHFVENFHSEHGHTGDFGALAAALGIRVEAAKFNKAFVTADGEPLILLDPDTSPSRLLFTGLHEIAHHLFWRANDGELKAYLDDYFYNRLEMVRAYEEEFCYEAAALLLMPTHVLRECIGRCTYSPLAVFELAVSTQASHEAAMRRVIYAHDYPIHAVLLSPDREVIASVAYGPKRRDYSVGRSFYLEPEHPLVVGNYTPGKVEQFSAAVPFKGGGRRWKSKVLAAMEPTSGRTLGFFMDTYPPSFYGMQSLF